MCSQFGNETAEAVLRTVTRCGDNKLHIVAPQCRRRALA